MMTTAADPAPARLHVVVCYATARQEILRELWLEQGATIGAAIEASGIVAEMARLKQLGQLGELADPRDPGMAGFDPAVHQVGIFGKKKPLDTVLRDGDRVELYRPLLADPKESRRRRASAKA
ncbi:MAG: RnfH family protein [Massilia sp.]|jgi:putative ubiquitin-RnfH superfamily antitoxin RatB of RatAB toxin-antitoxin module|nr:RnfH family protein [Massilia sp.]